MRVDVDPEARLSRGDAVVPWSPGLDPLLASTPCG
jgi:hypothetical protein